MDVRRPDPGPTAGAAHDTDDGSRWASRAWVAVVFVPFAFVLALIAGYVAYDLFGYKAEDSGVPLGVDLVASLISLAIALAPCAVAVVCGRRAAAAGQRRGLVPAVIGGLAGLGLTALTVGSLLGP
jgi:hypothetical protein